MWNLISIWTFKMIKTSPCMLCQVFEKHPPHHKLLPKIGYTPVQTFKFSKKNSVWK